MGLPRTRGKLTGGSVTPAIQVLPSNSYYAQGYSFHRIEERVDSASPATSEMSFQCLCGKPKWRKVMLYEIGIYTSCTHYGIVSVNAESLEQALDVAKELGETDTEHIWKHTEVTDGVWLVKQKGLKFRRTDWMLSGSCNDGASADAGGEDSPDDAPY
jgi:hypothetical protein